MLGSCYRNSLALAKEYGCKTVAFPSISTGVYRFPLKKAAAIAVDAILAFLEGERTIQSVTMVCFDEKTKAAYEQAFQDAAAKGGETWDV